MGQKTLEKCDKKRWKSVTKNVGKVDTLGTFTQKVLFLDYNKTKKRKKVGHFGV